jgi:hypothetical protein
MRPRRAPDATEAGYSLAKLRSPRMAARRSSRRVALARRLLRVLMVSVAVCLGGAWASSTRIILGNVGRVHESMVSAGVNPASPSAVLSTANSKLHVEISALHRASRGQNPVAHRVGETPAPRLGRDSVMLSVATDCSLRASLTPSPALSCSTRSRILGVALSSRTSERSLLFSWIAHLTRTRAVNRRISLPPGLSFFQAATTLTQSR